MSQGRGTPHSGQICPRSGDSAAPWQIARLIELLGPEYELGSLRGLTYGEAQRRIRERETARAMEEVTAAWREAEEKGGR